MIVHKTGPWENEFDFSRSKIDVQKLNPKNQALLPKSLVAVLSSVYQTVETSAQLR